ncbi:MAG: phytase [Chloroflexaceae bacterium]|nr:phytase [Chloroflexaceae bacterium]
MFRYLKMLLPCLVLLLSLTACGEPVTSPEPTSAATPASATGTEAPTDAPIPTTRPTTVTVTLSEPDATPPASATGTEAPTDAPIPTTRPTTATMTATLSEPEAAEGIPVVQPVLETHSVLDDIDEPPNNERLGDADDPAIWVHPDDPSLSLVVAVLKDGGLDVYDLNGEVLQSISPDGVRYNNVDLAYGFPLGGTPTDIIVATDRYQDRLVIFQVDPASRQLTDITDPNRPLLFTPEGAESDGETTAYGVAVYRDPSSGTFYAFANRRETGEIAQFELIDSGNGTIGWNRVRTMTVPTPEGGEPEDAQTEGMVVDPSMGFLYVGQENGGIWKFAAAPDGGSEGTRIHAVAPASNYLVADVEGLTIYFGPEGQGYLIASSQGNHTFAVFRREGNNDYIGSFQIGAAGDIDGVQECDGAMVLNVSLGERFPTGLLVVQDGHNAPLFPVEDDGEIENANANFKFVPWEQVAAAFDPPLLIDPTSYQPRTP